MGDHLRFPALAAHVLVDEDTDCHAVRRSLERVLAERFELTHTTLQVDHHHPELLQIENAAPAEAEGSGQPGGEADRVELDAVARLEAQRMALVAPVGGDVVEPGRRDLDPPRRLAVEADVERAAAVERDVGAAGLVGELERRRRPSGSRGEPPGNSSGVGGATSAPGASVGRSGSSGAGRAASASSSRSSSWIASSVARYSPSPKWNHRIAPPWPQRKRLGQPLTP